MKFYAQEIYFSFLVFDANIDTVVLHILSFWINFAALTLYLIIYVSIFTII